MQYKICSKCNEKKEIGHYNWRNQNKAWLHSFCKLCHAAYRKLHYLKNRNKYILKARVWNKQQTRVLRKFISNYLSTHPCVDCKTKDLRVLDFDHEGKKYMGIAQMIRNCHSVASLQREISVCKVRCANCHRIKTFVRGNYWKTKLGL